MHIWNEPMDKLIGALLEAQKIIKHAIDDKENPHFGSPYSSLESVISTIKPVLNEQGVYVQQKVHPDPDGCCVETIFYGYGHELNAGKLFLPASKRNPQAFGAALTFARRYSLATAFGIGHTEDYDAESAVSDNASLDIFDDSTLALNLRDAANKGTEALAKVWADTSQADREDKEGLKNELKHVAMAADAINSAIPLQP